MRHCPNRQPESPARHGTHTKTAFRLPESGFLLFKTDLQHRQRGIVIGLVGNFRHQLDMQHFVLFV